MSGDQNPMKKLVVQNGIPRKDLLRARKLVEAAAEHIASFVAVEARGS